MLTRPDFLRCITVGKLAELLAQLRPDDVLVANQVGNLSIVRDGTYLGAVDIVAEVVEIWTNEPTA